MIGVCLSRGQGGAVQLPGSQMMNITTVCKASYIGSIKPYTVLYRQGLIGTKLKQIILKKLKVNFLKFILNEEISLTCGPFPRCNRHGTMNFNNNIATKIS